MIDEAHATGVIGQTGHGTVEHFGNTVRPDILMGTLSKALGAEGGYACASKVIIEYLKNKARSFIFATSQTLQRSPLRCELQKCWRKNRNVRKICSTT